MKYNTKTLGFRVGHATDATGKTGVTAILFDRLSPVALESRGGAPGSRESLIAKSENLVPGINALVFTGGSALGLEAACGVSRVLRAAQVGFPTTHGPVPIVMGSVIYDLQPNVEPPSLELGQQAAQHANYIWEDGKVGAAAGAAAWRMTGNGIPTQLGVAMIQDGELYCIAIAVVNAWGAILLPGGPSTEEIGKNMLRSSTKPFEQTTLVAMITNASLNKTQLQRVAILADDGLARSIFPVHTAFDGDSVYAISCGDLKANEHSVGIYAGMAVENAVRNASIQTFSKEFKKEK